MIERVKVTKVFLSSTTKDLAEFRSKAAEAINSMDGYQCVQMENFGARDAAAEKFCSDQVAKCDLFVLLLGPTYGSRAPNSEKSFTELEYDAAVALNRPVLVFVTSEEFRIPQRLLANLSPGEFDNVLRFRQRVGAERIWEVFATPEELAAQLHLAIANWEKSRHLTSEDNARSDYLNYTINRNTYLDPRGIMQTVRAVSLKLDEVHVLLTAEREVIGGQMVDKWPQPPRAEFDDEPEGGEVSIDPESRAELSETFTERIDLDQAVRDHARIIMLGDPGAGKTTLVRFLALQFALAARGGGVMARAATVAGQETTVLQTMAGTVVRDKDGYEYGEARLPILVRIAEYAEAYTKNRNLKLREFLPNLCGNMNAPAAIAPVLNRALSQGQALVLLDGLDEIIDAGDRAQIARQIEDFVAGVDARNQFIVTSRIAGYRAAPLGGEFAHFTLCDLEREQIERFLKRWCVAVERFHTPRAPEAEITERAQREITGILKAMDENPGVQRLAANPLMLTILALIHRNGARLPRRRVELYVLATKTLLEDWQLARGVPSERVVKESEALQLLGPLAHWMHTHKPSGLAHEQEVKEKLAEALAATRNVAPDDPNVQEAVDDFLQRVREHTGIFVERAPRQFGFMHLTFEEYFAARELVRGRNEAAALIYERRHQPRWAEPILLAIGFVSDAFPKDAGELIRTAILAEGADAKAQGFKPSLYEDVLHQDLLFAARCIGDCASVEAGLRQQVVGRLVEIYLDIEGAGKYKPLQERLETCFEYFVGSDAGREAARLLLAALRHKSAWVRSNAARMLEKIGTPEVGDGLLAALRDEDQVVQRNAARALGKIGTPEIVTRLLAALRDEDQNVRRNAARALGEIRTGTPEVVAGLLAALRDEESDFVRRNAARALGDIKVGTPEVVAGLLEALRDKNVVVRSEVARALEKIGTPEVVTGLLVALRDEDAGVRGNATGALGKIGTPQAVTGLLALLRDENAGVRYVAAHVLGEIKAGTPEVVAGLLAELHNEDAGMRRIAAHVLGEIKARTPEVVAGLLTALRDRNVVVRSEAVWALGETTARTPEVVAGLLEALRDKNASVQSNAAWALGEIKAGAKEVVTKLLAALRDKSEGAVRRNAAGALGKIQAETPEVVAGLWKALYDDKPGVRNVAAWALGEIKAGTPEVVARLLALLGDANEDVQNDAARALGKIGTPEVVTGLLTVLRDRSDEVQSHAARTLGEIGTPQVVAGLLDALCHESEQVRRNAVWALQEIKAGTPEVGERLLVALVDRDAEVRRDAAWALQEIKDGMPEVVAGLLKALRDENVSVRYAAAWTLGELSKGRAPRLPPEIINQIATDLRVVLDDPHNKEMWFCFTTDKHHPHLYDAVWEALWLVCQRMDQPIPQASGDSSGGQIDAAARAKAGL